MKIRPLGIPGSCEISLDPRQDERGYFMRVYDREIMASHGLSTAWVQENQSLSRRKGTIRGLHYQRPPFAETKLVRVIAGAVLDVFVDLRSGSPTFGRWEAIELSAQSHGMVYIPKGCAHGFCALSDDVIIGYKVDNPYAPEFESGIRWDDPTLAIPWPVGTPIVSERDRALNSFSASEHVVCL